jgi:bifunctional non-homologous end joining protein LigD
MTARPTFFEPMKAATVASPDLSDPDWIYEIKFDGYRGIAVKNGEKVDLFSRTHLSLNDRFPGIVQAVAALPIRNCVLDGEICALDPRGRSSFQLLQNAARGTVPIVYYVFDLLFENGADLRPFSLTERKQRLNKLLLRARDPLRFSVCFCRDAEEVLTRMRRLGVEGAIAKAKESPYRSGARSADWVKIRFSLQQEFVIGGYTEPKGSRSGFGALLIGYYEGGRLCYASKVGTGFPEETLGRLHRLLRERETAHNPFSGEAGPPRAEAIHWVRPDLVAQVSFTEWTDDGAIRHPVFLGLRDDKPARRVVREIRSTTSPAT